MNVTIAGAGPAGLAFAIALAEQAAGHRLTIVDRGSPGDRPGWGVTLRPGAFDFLNLGALSQGPALQGRALWYRGELRVDLPNPEMGSLMTTGRVELVDAMCRRARELGVSFRWGVDAATLDPANADLVVAADGAYSALRERHAAHFRPTRAEGANVFAWLGTSRIFEKLSILVRDDSVPLLAWAYRYSDMMSTLIVELTAETFERTDLARDTELKVAQLLREELQGHAVRARPGMKWRRFPLVRCERLVHDNVVLIGDAAHTTHFSQGFGTVFAFDDARALSTSLTEHASLADALDAYELRQLPKIGEFQQTSTASMRWSEEVTRAADARDADAVEALIAARWPDNAVLRGPMDRPE